MATVETIEIILIAATGLVYPAIAALIGQVIRQGNDITAMREQLKSGQSHFNRLDSAIERIENEIKGIPDEVIHRLKDMGGLKQ